MLTRGFDRGLVHKSLLGFSGLAEFGAERAMFGSNFPVDSLCASFDDIAGGVKQILESFPQASQAAFFYGTAKQVYLSERP